mmetsp:Transcript_8658/g.11910  ORF Transcript_8658/g.11910 Transcript_8658/m.11910 type:complete len:149 (+) Transcript_8658:60-506(+)
MAALKEDELLLEAFNMQNPVNRKLKVSKLGDALRSIGKRLANDDIDELKKQATGEFNGGLTFDDFKKYAEKASKLEKTEEEIEKGFKVFANRESGKIEISKLKYALMNLGDKLEDKQVEAFFKAAGIDESKDKHVDYKRFMSTLKLAE